MKNRFLSLLSSLFRAFGQLAVFLILARLFAPDDFGRFSLYIAIASMLALLGDFGASTFSLPLLSEAEDRTHLAYREIFRFRWITLSAVMLAGMCLLPFAIRIDDRLLFSLCCGVGYVTALADFSLLPFRARRAYGDEALAAVSGALAYIAVVAVVAVTVGNMRAVAGAYLGARLLSLAIAWMLWFRLVRRTGLARQGVADGHMSFAGRLRMGSPYLADGLLSAAINYVDIFLIGALLGVAAVGVYQIPSKIMQASLLVVQIVVSIYVPQLAREKETTAWHGTARRMLLELTGVGMVMALGVALVVPFLADRFLGPAYHLPWFAWAGFATALLIRLASAGYGIILIVWRMPMTRVYGQAAVLGTFVAGVLLAARPFGLGGVAWSFSAAMGVAFVYYAATVRKMWGAG